MSRLVGLYPRAWRARYGDELEDLVAAQPLGAGGSLDLFLGALDAHRHPELIDPVATAPTGSAPVTRQRFEDLRVARRLGLASVAGALLWIGGWIVALNGPVVYNDDGTTYTDGASAAPIFVLAMVLLSGGLLGQLIRLPSARRAGRIGAVVALFFGPIWSFGPWNLFLGIPIIIGLVLLALSAWWGSEWGGTAALVTIGAALISPAAILLALFGWSTNRISSEGFLLLAIVSFTPIWLTVGGTLMGLPGSIDDGRPEAATLAGVADQA